MTLTWKYSPVARPGAGHHLGDQQRADLGSAGAAPRLEHAGLQQPARRDAGRGAVVRC